jgi:GDP-D-mannose 3', 5'-epimerase
MGKDPEMAQFTLVTGAGGFIGGHLVRDLLAEGVSVRAVDKKPLAEWYFQSPEAENVVADLCLADACDKVTTDVVHVYKLATDMGGMGLSRTTRPFACSRCSSTLTC